MAIPINQVVSHWAQSFQNFNMPSDTFYSQCENYLTSLQMPNVSIKRTKEKEGGILSASREFLRIKKGNLVFDVCASPFGKSFFISWWLYETMGTTRTMFKSTKIGNFLDTMASKKTIYQADTELMFQTIVHESLMEVLDSMLEKQANRKLTTEERLFKKKGIFA